MAENNSQSMGSQWQEARSIASRAEASIRREAQKPVDKKFLNDRSINNAGIGRFGAVPLTTYSPKALCVTCFGP